MPRDDSPEIYKVLMHYNKKGLFACDVCSLTTVFGLSEKRAKGEVAIAYEYGKAVVFRGDRQTAMAKAKQGNDFKVSKAVECDLFTPGFWFAVEPYESK